MRRSLALALLGLAVALLLSGCVSFSGYGVRLNATGTLDVVDCGGSHAVTRMSPQPGWEVVTVLYDEVRRSELTVGEWAWRGTSSVPYAPQRPCAVGAQFVPRPVAPSASSVAVIAAVVLTTVGSLVVAVGLSLSAHRHRRSNAGDRRFWVTLGLVGLPMAAAVVLGFSRLLEDDPTGLVLPVILGGPLGVIPAIEFVVAAGLIRPAEWSAFGYLWVSVASLIAIPAWAVVSIVGVRRLSQRSAQRSERDARPVLAPDP